MKLFIHPEALCESDQVGDGTRIWAFAHVMPEAFIGEECNICDHVFIEGGVRIGDRVTIKNSVLVFDGVTIEDDVFVGPGVVFTNDRTPRSPNKIMANQFVPTLIRNGATLGANVTVICGVTVGQYAFVGAGSVITKDLPDFGLAFGNPAALVGWSCICGKRLSESLICPCGRRYQNDEDRLVLC